MIPESSRKIEKWTGSQIKSEREKFGLALEFGQRGEIVD